MIKSFRKSKRLLNSLLSLKHSISRVALTQYSQDELHHAIKLPQKVIKALYDYKPQGPGELEFQKGDFFHVVNPGQGDHEENGWFDATNPATRLRGMVPMLYFETFDKPVHHAGAIEQSNPLGAKLLQVSGSATVKLQTLYAMTLFEFKAERPDELDIMPGENLVICAHHEFEWLIAKPITRLGGPGLVPALYVKIVDVLSPDAMAGASTAAAAGTGPSPGDQQNIADVIRHFNIPTVEQWKEQTAKYQALTIPLGYISGAAPPVLQNSHFFETDPLRTSRLLLLLTKTYVVDAAVELYHLEHGRYQYLVVARLLNGKVRSLLRFYQDFYDLQVKLLELFPYEAGKIENLRRIIPLIPGPLINVNDLISKLRREKLDYYLRNLVALPAHILRCDEVLTLFEILENGYDKESDHDESARHSVSSDGGGRPVHRPSNSHQDRLSQYLAKHHLRNSVTPTDSPGPATSASSSEKLTKVKVKFYFEDDIFVLLLPMNLRLRDLKLKLRRRLGLEESEDAVVNLFLKNDYDEFMDSNNIATDVLSPDQRERLFQLEINDDTKFQGVLFDKCKVVILAG